MFLNHVKPYKHALAARMRRKPTEAERTLRKALYAACEGKYAVRFQVIMKGYVLDFYVPSRRVAIEVDGSSHDARSKYDENRDAVLRETCKVHTIRVSNQEVMSDVAAVVDRIMRFVSMFPAVKSWNEGLKYRR